MRPAPGKWQLLTEGTPYFIFQRKEVVVVEVVVIVEDEEEVGVRIFIPYTLFGIVRYSIRILVYIQVQVPRG